MPFVKVTDLAYGRLQSPSLDEAEEFLTRFGMVRSERTPNALYMRGTDPAHHLHVTHLGPSKFIGLAFFVENEDHLKKFAKRSEEHTSELQSLTNLVCRLLLEKKKKTICAASSVGLTLQMLPRRFPCIISS